MRSNHSARPRHFRRSLARAALAGAIVACLPAYTAVAQAPQATTEAARRFDIPAGELGAALDRFSTQSGLQVAYQRELVAGKQARTLTGQLTWSEALDRLLAGSGLEYRQVNKTTIAIRRSGAGVGIGTGTSSRPVTEPQAAAATDAETDVTEMDRLTVTGTRIRGGVSASPTIAIDEMQFRQEGFTDLGEVIRSIPQNFRGGQNPGVTYGATTGIATNENVTGGSSLNLRGLGADASLTLLNGRRLSYEGYSNAVDISAIPIEAVARVEIVPDGASAIYGSDAVGGVANVVLRRDFDGVAIGALYGNSADGGLKRHEYTATAGTTWNSGGLIATFKKSDQDPIFADQRAYTQEMYHPSTIYNGNALRSGLLSAHQAVGENVELHLDALRTEREGTSFRGFPSHYTSNTGSKNTSTLFAPSLQMALPSDWLVTAGVSRGRSEILYKGVRVVGDVQTLQSDVCLCNETETWELGAEGPLARFGERDVRLAVGLGGRATDFLQHNFLTDGRQEGDEHSRYAYGELSLPVVGADNARPGMQRLEFSAAVRTEDYSSFGSVTTPKLGVIYSPNANFTLKGSWGRSFKAPNLSQRYYDRSTMLVSAWQFGCTTCADDATVLFSQGGNPNLEPERARTWSASLAFHPEALPSLEAELTYFVVNYSQRVVEPIPNRRATLSDPAYAPFIQYDPSVEAQQELLAVYGDVFHIVTADGAGYDPSKVIAIASGQQMNAAQQRARGADLSGSYRLDLAAGQLQFRGGISWLDLSQQSFPGQPVYDLSGLVYFPTKFNGRLGAVWSQGGLSASAFVNYMPGVTNTVATSTQKTASFTTFDATLRYETAPGAGPLSGLTLALSVDNVFNRAPPLFTALDRGFAPYDSTNYSAIGRYVTASISKRW